jgi:protein gp37
MGETTHISWADATLNFWIGCTEVSPACDFCYARAYGHRFGVEWGPHAERRRTLHCLAKARAIERRQVELGHRPFVFSNSLSDIFDREVPIAWLADAFEVMRATPGAIYLLLTKRIGIVPERVAAAGGLPPNAAVGATFCNQDEWDRDSGKLRRVREELAPLFVFASFEPLLGPIRRNGGWWPDWAICGGESGPNARPPHPDWVRGIRDDSEEFGTPFEFKQWGEWTPGENVERRSGTVPTASLISDREGWFFCEENLASTDGHIDDEPDLYRIGKKAAGRRLDGVIHDARLQVRA